MSEYRPSKYIMHSGYASVKAYPIISVSVSVPAQVIVPINDDTIYRAVAVLPEGKQFGWRSLVSSSKDNYAVSTPNFLAPCTITEDGDTFDGYFYGSVVRTSQSTIELLIVFTGSEHFSQVITNAEQTFTLKLQPYLSPFEA